jgi:hypothetical protein
MQQRGKTMPIIQTEQHSDHWIARLPGQIPALDKVARGLTEQEAVNLLAYFYADASIVLHHESDYWIERWMPKTDREAVETLYRAFGIS